MSGARVHPVGQCSDTCSCMMPLSTTTPRRQKLVSGNRKALTRIIWLIPDYTEAINVTSIAGDKGKHAYSCEVSGSFGYHGTSVSCEHHRTIPTVLM